MMDYSDVERKEKQRERGKKSNVSAWALCVCLGTAKKDKNRSLVSILGT